MLSGRATVSIQEDLRWVYPEALPAERVLAAETGDVQVEVRSSWIGRNPDLQKRLLGYSAFPNLCMKKMCGLVRLIGPILGV